MSRRGTIPGTGRTTILLARHGQIVQQPTGPDGSRRYVGNIDIPLDEDGRAQGREMARVLAGLPVAVAVSSDLGRSVETAELALAGLPVAPELRREPALREICIGDWQGMYPAEVRRQYPGAWEARGADLAGYRPPGGENFTDVADRALPALLSIARDLHATGDAQQDRTALVVAHAGVNLAILCRLMDLPLASALAMPQDYCGLNVLVWNEEWQHLAVRTVNLLPPALGPNWARAYDVIG